MSQSTLPALFEYQVITNISESDVWFWRFQCRSPHCKPPELKSLLLVLPIYPGQCLSLWEGDDWDALLREDAITTNTSIWWRATDRAMFIADSYCYLVSCSWNPTSKYKTLNQCCYHVGSTSATVFQRKTKVDLLIVGLRSFIAYISLCEPTSSGNAVQKYVGPKSI